MEQVIISDNKDILTGFRLSGIRGVFANKESVIDLLNIEINNPDNAIIFITANLANSVRDVLDNIKVNTSKPIITEIS